ncbi:hypothetical protein BDA99DRAFT_496708 [Phascolomyces articulosus]|uniref:F-box domain-containing protein n=1 Tax=Phascolomyces articulosus TaxID=60185 RepID=A0AAD5KUQ4_9FUNG|nr:hypothetical protein BDA99DRAFT_496708 [Phascolomyces articulosus]
MDHVIDFIVQLPNEILTLIFSSLTTEELGIVSLVSPAWQHRIAHCDQLWQSFTLRQDDETSWLMIPNVQQHVKILYFYCSPNTQRSIHASDIEEYIGNRAKGYTNILKRKRVYHRKVNTSYIKYRFLKVMPIAVILESFPNLIHLELKHYSSANLTDSLITMTTKTTTKLFQYQHLTALRLACSGGYYYKTEDVIHILRQCPSIRYLSVSYCSFQLLHAIDCYSSNLEVVVFNVFEPSSSDGYPSNMILHRHFLSAKSIHFDMTRRHRVQQDQQGGRMRSLFFFAKSLDFIIGRRPTNNRNHPEDYKDISRMIVHNAHSLEELVLYPIYLPGDEARSLMMKGIQWNSILTKTFNHLQRLCCNIPYSKEHAFATMIRHNCPSLMDCSIVYHGALMPSVVLDALSEKINLRRLVLTIGTSSVDISAFQRLLQNNHKGKNGIQHLVFERSGRKSPLSNALLESLITAQHGLRGFEINKCWIDWFAFEKLMRDIDQRRDTLLEWIIYNKAWYIDDDRREYSGEWMVGEDSKKLETLDLETFRAFTPDPIVSDISVFIQPEKHPKFAQELTIAGSNASNVVYSFLQDQLEFS